MFAWVKPAAAGVARADLRDRRPRRPSTAPELEPLDEAAVRTAARRLREAGVRSVAVCFLHGYANAEHERRAGALLLAEHPHCAVSLSSEVLPVFREFERSMGTVLNAYVQPLVGRYVGRLAERLRGRGIAAPLSIMKSNGGVIGADVVQTQAIHTALSGPAAGVIGARRIGEAAGFADLISVDVGGTSADVCLVRGGEAEVTVEGRIGSWPLHVPMIDIHTIGAGGGSIARVTAGRHADGGARERGGAAGPGLLRRRRRGAHRHRRPPGARPHPGAPARRRDRARRRAGAAGHRGAGGPAARAPAGGGGAGHPRHRQQQHGRRAPAGVGRARLRPARLRARPLRRRRPAARRRPRRAARHAHDRGPAPSRRAVHVRPARHRGAQRLRAHESAEAARLRPRRGRRGVRRAGRTGRGVAGGRSRAARPRAASRAWPTCATATRGSS